MGTTSSRPLSHTIEDHILRLARFIDVAQHTLSVLFASLLPSFSFSGNGNNSHRRRRAAEREAFALTTRTTTHTNATPFSPASLAVQHLGLTPTLSNSQAAPATLSKADRVREARRKKETRKARAEAAAAGVPYVPKERRRSSAAVMPTTPVVVIPANERKASFSVTAAHAALAPSAQVETAQQQNASSAPAAGRRSLSASASDRTSEPAVDSTPHRNSGGSDSDSADSAPPTPLDWAPTIAAALPVGASKNRSPAVGAAGFAVDLWAPHPHGVAPIVEEVEPKSIRGAQVGASGDVYCYYAQTPTKPSLAVQQPAASGGKPQRTNSMTLLGRTNSSRSANRASVVGVEKLGKSGGLELEASPEAAHPPSAAPGQVQRTPSSSSRISRVTSGSRHQQLQPRGEDEAAADEPGSAASMFRRRRHSSTHASNSSIPPIAGSGGAGVRRSLSSAHAHAPPQASGMQSYASPYDNGSQHVSVEDLHCAPLAFEASPSLSRIGLARQGRRSSSNGSSSAAAVTAARNSGYGISMPANPPSAMMMSAAAAAARKASMDMAGMTGHSLHAVPVRGRAVSGSEASSSGAVTVPSQSQSQSPSQSQFQQSQQSLQRNCTVLPVHPRGLARASSSSRREPSVEGLVREALHISQASDNSAYALRGPRHQPKQPSAASEAPTILASEQNASHSQLQSQPKPSQLVLPSSTTASALTRLVHRPTARRAAASPAHSRDVSRTEEHDVAPAATVDADMSATSIIVHPLPSASPVDAPAPTKSIASRPLPPSPAVAAPKASTITVRPRKVSAMAMTTPEQAARSGSPALAAIRRGNTRSIALQLEEQIESVDPPAAAAVGDTSVASATSSAAQMEDEGLSELRELVSAGQYGTSAGSYPRRGSMPGRSVRGGGSEKDARDSKDRRKSMGVVSVLTESIAEEGRDVLSPIQRPPSRTSTPGMAFFRPNSAGPSPRADGPPSRGQTPSGTNLGRGVTPPPRSGTASPGLGGDGASILRPSSANTWRSLLRAATPTLTLPDAASLFSSSPSGAGGPREQLPLSAMADRACLKGWEASAKHRKTWKDEVEKIARERMMENRSRNEQRKEAAAAAAAARATTPELSNAQRIVAAYKADSSVLA